MGTVREVMGRWGRIGVLSRDVNWVLCLMGVENEVELKNFEMVRTKDASLAVSVSLEVIWSTRTIHVMYCTSEEI